MLNTAYANYAEMRTKYSCIVASRIDPLLPAADYLDKESRENELKQATPSYRCPSSSPVGAEGDIPYPFVHFVLPSVMHFMPFTGHRRYTRIA